MKNKKQGETGYSRPPTAGDDCLPPMLGGFPSGVMVKV